MNNNWLQLYTLSAAIKTLTAKAKLHHIEEEFCGEPDAKLKKQDEQMCPQLWNGMEPQASAHVMLGTAYSVISPLNDTFASNDNNVMSFHDEARK